MFEFGDCAGESATLSAPMKSESTFPVVANLHSECTDEVGVVRCAVV